MSSRKENLKKLLGIPEYPWSSDDDDVELSPSMQDYNILQRRAAEPQQANATSSRATSSIAQTQPQSRYQPRVDHQPSWNRNPSRGSSVALPRSRVDVPLALVSRPPHSSTERPNSLTNNVHSRMLAFKKLYGGFLFESRSNGNSYSPTGTPPRSSRDSALSTARLAALSNHVSQLMKAKARSKAQRSGYVDPDRVDTNLNSVSGEAEPSSSLLPHSLPLPSSSRSENIDRSDDDEAEQSSVAEQPPIPADDDAAPNDASGGNDTQNLSAMSLEEEIVEIDPEPEPGPSTAQGTENTASAEPAVEAGPNEEPQQQQGVKRKREEENNEPQSVQEFNQNLLRLLECPVCLEWMEPPMSQCRRGHLVCSRCRARLESCPVCRTSFSSVRNRAMEGVAELLRYPCRHGCGREVRLRRRAPHEASCASRRYRCPAPTCQDRSPLARHELARHAQTKHLPILKIGKKHKFSMRMNAEQKDDWLVMVLQEIFHLRVDVDIRTWGVVVYVAYIGPMCNAKNYVYEVTVLGQHNARKLSYTRSTHCDLECSSLNISRQDCFHLSLDQALNYLRVKNSNCEPDKFLNFTVEITKAEIDSSKDDSDS